jgi:hypothetical protein
MRQGRERQVAFSGAAQSRWRAAKSKRVYGEGRTERGGQYAAFRAAFRAKAYLAKAASYQRATSCG